MRLLLPAMRRPCSLWWSPACWPCRPRRRRRLPQPLSIPATVLRAGLVAGYAFQAQSFMTGPNSAGYPITQVRLMVNNNNTAGLSTSVTIRENDASNRPGDLVATLTYWPPLVGGNIWNFFTPPSRTPAVRSTSSQSSSSTTSHRHLHSTRSWPPPQCATPSLQLPTRRPPHGTDTLFDHFTCSVPKAKYGNMM